MADTACVEVLVVVLVVCAVAVAAWLAYRYKQKRLAAFALAATQLGLDYSRQDPFDTLSEPFAFFEKGDGRGVENVLSGRWQDVDIHLFDYWYYERSTDANGHTSKTYYRFSCVTSPIEAACSRLMIGHENIGTRLAGALTFRDIEFESEDFNREFYVKSSDAKFANDLVDARMMEWLMTHAEDFSFEVADDRILCYQKRIWPTEIVSLLGISKAFRDHIPRVVYDLYPR